MPASGNKKKKKKHKQKQEPQQPKQQPQKQDVDSEDEGQPQNQAGNEDNKGQGGGEQPDQEGHGNQPPKGEASNDGHEEEERKDPKKEEQPEQQPDNEGHGGKGEQVPPGDEAPEEAIDQNEERKESKGRDEEQPADTGPQIKGQFGGGMVPVSRQRARIREGERPDFTRPFWQFWRGESAFSQMGDMYARMFVTGIYNTIGVLAASSCIAFAYFASPEDRPYFAAAALGFGGLVARDLYRGGMTLTNAVLTTTACVASVVGIAALVASRMPEATFHYGQDVARSIVQGLALKAAETFTDIGTRGMTLSSLASDHLLAGTAISFYFGAIRDLCRGGMSVTRNGGMSVIKAAALATTGVGLAYAFVNTTYGAQISQDLALNVSGVFTSFAERCSNNTIASMMGRSL